MALPPASKLGLRACPPCPFCACPFWDDAAFEMGLGEVGRELDVDEDAFEVAGGVEVWGGGPLAQADLVGMEDEAGVDALLIGGSRRGWR